MIETKHTELNIRIATEEDLRTILWFVKELASYENLLHEVKATEESLRDAIFNQKIAKAVIAEYAGEPSGFAIFYYSLSTFIGRPAIYIEDLFVKPDMRRKGVGNALLSYLASLAKENNCWGLEWSCLNWNEPSIKFYRSLGAVPRDEWTIFRLSGTDLDNIASTYNQTKQENKK